jgi:RNA polymerase sigma-70 factor, ECF subfamily
MGEPNGTVESIFRRESGRIIASLIRISQSFDLAEEALQDAFASALIDWTSQGIPENPAAWITTAARRKLLDYCRRDRTRRDKEGELRYHIESSEAQAAADLEDRIDGEDDRLRLIFTCCHPALNMQAQVALTLRTLGGLSTAEIARAFLLPETTLSQRLVRAKNKIQQARIPYEIPRLDALPGRIAAVQAVLYLIFNEGYTASSGDILIRRELCGEAIRLARTLCELMPDMPENLGLLALMLLHDSRRETRVNAEGELVPLDGQDRSFWDHEQIDEGCRLVEAALRQHSVGPYQIQAAIAALHAEAGTAADTDWKQIAALYGELARMQPSATVALNRAVAMAMAYGIEAGLELLESLGASGTLHSYYLFHAARADLLRRLSRKADALAAYERALSLTANAVERRFLRRRIAELNGG